MTKFFYIRKSDANTLSLETVSVLKGLVQKGKLDQDTLKELQKHRGTPVAVVAMNVVDGVVSFAVSTHLPKDDTNRELARSVANSRLERKKDVVSAKVDGKLTSLNVIKTVLTAVCDTKTLPARTRKAALEMLKKSYAD